MSSARWPSLCVLVLFLGLLLAGCQTLVSTGVRDDARRLSMPARVSLAIDRWDPLDDTWAGASVLPISTVRQTHGSRGAPHTIGCSGDQVDHFRIWIEFPGTYTFTATAAGGTLGMVLCYIDPGSGAEQHVRTAKRDGRTWTLRLTNGPLGAEGPSGWWCLKVTPGTPSPSTSYVLGYVYSETLFDLWDPGDDVAKRGTDLGSANSPGEHGRHTLSEEDTMDWFVVTLSAGRTYGFRGSPESSANLDLYLYKDRCGPRQTPVASGLNGAPLTYTPARDGPFYLKVVADSVGDLASYVLEYGPTP